MPSSAAAWTTCRSRSSSPRPARKRCSPPDPRTALPAPRPVEGRPRRRSPPADTAGDDRVVARPARAGGAAALRAAFRVRRLHARGRRGSCDADLDTLQSLVEKSLLRFTDGALLDAGDDPRVRRAAAGALARGAGDSAGARGLRRPDSPHSTQRSGHGLTRWTTNRTTSEPRSPG